MKRIEPAVLEATAERIVAALGAPADVARDVAASLVEADCRGHGSHGVVRLGQYAEMIDDGAIDPAAEPRCRELTPATAHVDGRSAFGQYTGRLATATAIELAETCGVGVVGVRNGTHLGRLGEWAERATAEGMVLAVVANTQGGALTVAPPGSAEPRLATNPIAVGVPSFGALPFPIVYDAATSQVANGKIREREHTGESLPGSWTTTPDGEAITDPAAFFDPEEPGALLPLGGHATGHKGFGLAVVVELLAGLVGDGAVAGESDPDWFDNAATVVAIDPRRFTTRETARERVATLAAHLRSAELSPSLPTATADRPLLPGEPEHETARERLEHGIPLDDRVLASLLELADELDVAVADELEP